MKFTYAVVAALGAFSVAACDVNEGPVEEAAEDVDLVIEDQVDNDSDVEDAIRDAGETIENTANDAGDAINDAAENAEDAINDAADDVEDATTNPQ